MRVRVVLGIAFLVGVLVVAACSRGPNRLSQEDFEERVGAACAAANDEVGDLAVVGSADPERAAAGIEATTGVQRELRDELAALHPPQEHEATYEAWLEDIDRVLAAFDDLADALRTGDAPGQAHANGAAVTASQGVDAGSVALGLDSCLPEG